nr:NAD(P)-binding protein [Sphingomonas melonis]
MPAGLTVVVGGGAAGIAAARALHDAGAEVLLVEAGDRLGGRARSLRLPIDGSAAFVPLTPSPRTRSGVHRAAGGIVRASGRAPRSRVDPGTRPG